MSKRVFFAVCLMAIIMFESACNAYREPNAFEINKIINRGVNIGNALEAPNEGEWGVTIQEEYFQFIKNAGFNSIRLPVCWSAHALNEKPYTIDPNLFKRVDWAVNNCLSRNLLMALNVHHYRELSANPAGHQERFLALWKQIAERYKDYPDTLVFELLNEPEGNLKAAEWNAMLKEALNVVRQSNPTRMVVIGPVNYNDIRLLNTLELPKDDRNIIVTAHYYLPFQFTHQGASWVKDSNSSLGMKWKGTDQEKRAIVKDFNVAVVWGKTNNRPIYIGEFGAYSKADMDSRARWTKFVADTAIERGFSFAYWEFCAGFGLYDPNANSFRKPLLDALIPPRKP